jgi:hypothetical protein
MWLPKTFTLCVLTFFLSTSIAQTWNVTPIDVSPLKTSVQDKRCIWYNDDYTLVYSMLKDTVRVELRQMDAMYSWSYTFTDRYTIRSELSCDTLKWFTFSSDKKKYLFVQGYGVYPWNEGRLQQWEFGYILPFEASEDIVHIASTLSILNNIDFLDGINIKQSLDYGKSISSIKVKSSIFIEENLSNMYWSNLTFKSEHGDVDYSLHIEQGYIYKRDASGLHKAPIKSTSEIIKGIQQAYTEPSFTPSSVNIAVLNSTGLTSWKVSPTSKHVLLLWAALEESFNQ